MRGRLPPPLTSAAHAAPLTRARRGYNIGTRLIEDFLARTGLQRCQTFSETAEVVSKVAFKTFLNITPSVSFPPAQAASPAQSTEFVLTFDENPLDEFAELPPDAREGGLWFSNVYAGVIRGALEMVSARQRGRGRALLTRATTDPDAGRDSLPGRHAARRRRDGTLRPSRAYPRRGAARERRVATQA